jgi:hypothetical protein
MAGKPIKVVYVNFPTVYDEFWKFSSETDGQVCPKLYEKSHGGKKNPAQGLIAEFGEFIGWMKSYYLPIARDATKARLDRYHGKEKENHDSLEDVLSNYAIDSKFCFNCDRQD